MDHNMTIGGLIATSDYQLIGPSEDGTVSDFLGALGTKDSRQRLQALISEWLRMENLVVMTGSGGSVSSGGKTMDTLERAVLQTVARLPGAPASLGAILDARLAPPPPGMKTKRIGFEDWLSYLVNAYALGSTVGSPISSVAWHGVASPSTADLEWAVKWIGNAIFAECALSLLEERWLRNFEQGVKWKLGLTAGMFCLRIRSEDEEASPPEPHTGLQGEGGPCCPEKRSNDCTAC
jgi:hypothetical protein